MTKIEMIANKLEAAIYLDRGFKQIIEDHLFMLKNGATEFDVAPVLQHRFNGNFYGLLAEIPSLPFNVYWITMRCNDFTSPYEYREGKSIIKIPSMDAIEDLYNQYNTRRKK